MGWFGFNAGSAGAANGIAGLAFINTILATGAATVAWLVADTLNALMAIPNLIVLLLLSPQIVALTREYFSDDPEDQGSPVPVVQPEGD